MKNQKYKLKKWYPSLGHYLSVGDIVVPRNTEPTTYTTFWTTKKPLNKYLTKDEVRNNPEFWEKLTYAKYDETYNVKTAQIESVTRISDGVVFHLGDFAITKTHSLEISSNQCDVDMKQDYHKIEMFIKESEQFFMVSKGHILNLDLFNPNIALFITEDEFNISYGDTFNVVEDHTLKIHRDVKYPQFSNLDKHIRFRQYESARDYVIERKPILNIKTLKSLIYIDDDALKTIEGYVERCHFKD